MEGGKDGHAHSNTPLAFCRGVKSDSWSLWGWICKYLVLVHGILAWGTASSNVLEPLKVLSHRVLKIMTFAPFGNINLNPILNVWKFLIFLKYLTMKLLNFFLKTKTTFFLVQLEITFKWENTIRPFCLLSLFLITLRHFISIKIFSPRMDFGAIKEYFIGLWASVWKD